MACLCLSLAIRSSGAKPFVPFGKASESSQEGGNTGRRAMQPYRPHRGQAVRSAPGRDQAESGVYTRILPRRNRKSGSRPRYLAAVFGAQPVVDRPDLVGKADRHRGTVAQALRPRRFVGQVLVAVERVEQLLEAS